MGTTTCPRRRPKQPASRGPSSRGQTHAPRTNDPRDGPHTPKPKTPVSARTQNRPSQSQPKPAELVQPTRTQPTDPSPPAIPPGDHPDRGHPDCGSARPGLSRTRAPAGPRSDQRPVELKIGRTRAQPNRGTARTEHHQSSDQPGHLDLGPTRPRTDQTVAQRDQEAGQAGARSTRAPIRSAAGRGPAEHTTRDREPTGPKPTKPSTDRTGDPLGSAEPEARRAAGRPDQGPTQPGPIEPGSAKHREPREPGTVRLGLSRTGTQPSQKPAGWGDRLGRVTDWAVDRLDPGNRGISRSGR